VIHLHRARKMLQVRQIRTIPAAAVDPIIEEDC
jgi:hypothetical protein